MRRSEATAWVVTVCAGCLRRSQAKTLSILVAAALRVERVSLANIGRAAVGAAKHQIKRCWRFCANPRVETADAMRGVVKRLVNPKRKKPLLVALDWVDIKGYQTLVASAVLQGRSVPLCWASTQGHVYDGHRSRNAFEESLLLVLRSMVPTRVTVIILADRGFGRTALATFCRRHGFSYVIRIGPKVTVRLRGFHGKLLDYPVKRGVAKVLRDVRYRADGAVTQHVVVRWKPGLPAKRDECWFLMSDLKGTARQLCALYSRRMTIEQLSRDGKSKRNGWSLRDTQLSSPDRPDRLLLVLAIAYLLLCGIGLIARQTHKPADWCSSSREQCSVFRIGLIMLAKLKASPPQAFAAVFDLSETVVQNWG
jgi:Transposase DDE domain